MKVFTIGQVAKICKVAPRTVAKWFDSGRLKGYRIPGSQDRRIPREYLIKFLKEQGMPLGDLEDEDLIKILFVTQNAELAEAFRAALPSAGNCKLAMAASAFEAGIQAESFHPDCIVVDFAIGIVQVANFLGHARPLDEDVKAAIIVAIASPVAIDQFQLQVEIAERVEQPFDSDALLGRICARVALRKESA